VKDAGRTPQRSSIFPGLRSGRPAYSTRILLRRFTAAHGRPLRTARGSAVSVAAARGRPASPRCHPREGGGPVGRQASVCSGLDERWIRAPDRGPGQPLRGNDDFVSAGPAAPPMQGHVARRAARDAAVGPIARRGSGPRRSVAGGPVPGATLCARHTATVLEVIEPPHAAWKDRRTKVWSLASDEASASQRSAARMVRNLRRTQERRRGSSHAASVTAPILIA
jgi:hypothetical protein